MNVDTTSKKVYSNEPNSANLTMDQPERMAVKNLDFNTMKLKNNKIRDQSHDTNSVNQNCVALPSINLS